jgi:hypothetical protein
MPYESKIYTHFRYIAYETQTETTVGSRDDISKTLFGPVNVPAYREEDFGFDMHNRLTRFAAVINYARAQLQATAPVGPTVLNIFVAPEFYFRPPDSPGAYDEEYAHGLPNAFLGMFTDLAFEHWLFVCGTHCVTRNYAKRGNIYFNSLFAIKGGHADAPRRIVQKRYFADRDRLPIDRSVWNSPLLKTVINQWIVRSQCLFDVDNVRIGTEICLDHEHGILNQTCQEEIKVSPGTVKPVDLQIIAACALEKVVSTSVAVKSGGHILWCDGFEFANQFSALYPVARGTSGEEAKIGETLDRQLTFLLPATMRGDRADDKQAAGGTVPYVRRPYRERVVAYPVTSLTP